MSMSDEPAITINNQRLSGAIRQAMDALDKPPPMRLTFFCSPIVARWLDEMEPEQRRDVLGKLGFDDYCASLPPAMRQPQNR